METNNIERKQYANVDAIIASIKELGINVSVIDTLEKFDSLLTISGSGEDEQITVNTDKEFLLVIDNSKFENTYIIDMLEIAFKASPTCAEAFQSINIFILTDLSIKKERLVAEGNDEIFNADPEKFELEYMNPFILGYNCDKLFSSTEQLAPISQEMIEHILDMFIAGDIDDSSYGDGGVPDEIEHPDVVNSVDESDNDTLYEAEDETCDWVDEYDPDELYEVEDDEDIDEDLDEDSDEDTDQYKN